jgi:hypothetical protein
MGFIKYTKNLMVNELTEKRPSAVFIKPDIFMKFSFHKTMVVFDGIIDSLESKWKEALDTWDTTIDFRKNEEDDVSKYKQCFKCVDFSNVPTLTESELHSSDDRYIPFAFSLDRDVYINLNFIEALKNAGAVDIWYDTLAGCS